MEEEEKIKCLYSLERIYYIFRFIDEENRIIIKLYLQGLQPKEIASELNISIKTVHKNIHHFLYLVKVILVQQ